MGRSQQGVVEVPFATQIQAATGLAADQYLEKMQVGRADDASTWGGVLEGKILADHLKLRIRFLEKVQEGWMELCVAEEANFRNEIAVAWSGIHFNIAKITSPCGAGS